MAVHSLTREGDNYSAGQKIPVKEQSSTLECLQNLKNNHKK
jgi:hypothetical protein